MLDKLFLLLKILTSLSIVSISNLLSALKLEV